jgi:hypothetical protein
MAEEEDLQEHLNKDVDKNPKKRTFTRLNEDEDTEEEENESQSEENGPITRRTRDLIYEMWANIAVENPDKYLKLVEKISKLTEAQAKAYYESLEASRRMKVHCSLSEKLLKYTSGKILHPDDLDGKKELENDIHLKSEISSWISHSLSYVYPFSVPVVLAIYSFTSHWYYGELQRHSRNAPVQNEKTTTNDSTEKTFSSDGVRQESNGQNNFNG